MQTFTNAAGVIVQKHRDRTAASTLFAIRITETMLQGTIVAMLAIRFQAEGPVFVEANVHITREVCVVWPIF